MTDKKDDKIIFKKDNSVHSEEEFRNAIYSDYPIIDRYLLKKCDLNISKLQHEFIDFTDDERLKASIKDNFKLYDLKEKDLILISYDMFDNYISQAIQKVSLVLDKIYK